MHGRPWFDVRPGETPVAFEIREMLLRGWRWLIRRYVLGAVDFVVLVRVGVDEGPDDLLVWRDLNESPCPTGADEGIVVEHSLGAAKAVGKEVGRQQIMPGEISRAIGSPRRKIVFAGVVVYIRGDLIDA